jgi:pyridoxine 5-phosphate synthase
MTQLGVNIDHIATLRQLRHASFPDILLAARTCEAAGADSIVVHLREDRRHIQDADVRLLRRFVKTRLNLEMSIAPTIVSIACRVGPDQATLVPEKRQELTTEGGLDVARLSLRVGRAVDKLRQAGIDVSLFIEPDLRQVQAAVDVGAGAVEIHTGHYADARSKAEFRRHLSRIRKAVDAARAKGLIVNAGHGLDYANVCGIASLSGVRELNIGYAIVCHAVFVGLARAVRQMKTLVSRRS